MYRKYNITLCSRARIICCKYIAGISSTIVVSCTQSPHSKKCQGLSLFLSEKFAPSECECLSEWWLMVAADNGWMDGWNNKALTMQFMLNSMKRKKIKQQQTVFASPRGRGREFKKKHIPVWINLPKACGTVCYGLVGVKLSALNPEKWFCIFPKPA